MNEHPILFSGEMVRAIQDGRKTQTRRVIKPQFGKTWGYGVRNQDLAYYSVHVDILESNGEWRWLRCPYGKPGDRLWVRETWGFSAKLPASTKDEMSWLAYPDLRAYRADNPEGNWCWRPSIFMPRWASRITLEIVSIRVQRVQDISEEDAKAEGLYEWLDKEGKAYYGINRPDVWEQDPRITFKRLWNSINADRGFPWESNPWVWAIEFKEVEP